MPKDSAAFRIVLVLLCLTAIAFSTGDAAAIGMEDIEDNDVLLKAANNIDTMKVLNLLKEKDGKIALLTKAAVAMKETMATKDAKITADIKALKIAKSFLSHNSTQYLESPKGKMGSPSSKEKCIKWRDDVQVSVNNKNMYIAFVASTATTALAHKKSRRKGYKYLPLENLCTECPKSRAFALKYVKSGTGECVKYKKTPKIVCVNLNPRQYTARSRNGKKKGYYGARGPLNQFQNDDDNSGERLCTKVVLAPVEIRASGIDDWKVSKWLKSKWFLSDLPPTSMGNYGAYCEARKEVACSKGQCAVKKMVKCKTVCKRTRESHRRRNSPGTSGISKTEVCDASLCRSDHAKGEYGDYFCRDVAMAL